MTVPYSQTIDLPDNKTALFYWEDDALVQVDIRDDRGHELVTWTGDEIEDDPIVVVGAIFGAMTKTVAEIRSITGR